MSEALVSQVVAGVAALGWPEASGCLMDCDSKVAVRVRVTPEPRYWAARMELGAASPGAFDKLFREKVSTMEGWVAP